jgi:hypothetical protein
MNTKIVLQADNPAEFPYYAMRRKYFRGSDNTPAVRGGQKALGKAEGSDSKAYIIPSKKSFDKLGPQNTIVLVGTGIKIIPNKAGKDYKCPISGESFPYHFYYEFDRIDTVKFDDLVAILGNPYEHPQFSGNNFYLK